MNIGIDASRALRPQRTGTENYSLELIRHLLALAEESEERQEFVLYTDRIPPSELFETRPGLRVQPMPFPRLWTHLRLSWEMVTHPPDVLFVPAHVIPLLHPKKTVVTIHDLGHLYFPDAYPRRMRHYITWATRRNARVASHILADSEATKQDIIAKLGVSPERLTVVYPGVSSVFQPVTDADALREVQRRYCLPPSYILHVGTLQPRKNVLRLLEAFALAKERSHLQETLVLAGRRGWMPDAIERRLAEMKDTVAMVGYVGDEDLPALYSGATAFVLPSLFEGFGMPAVEAMACGAPVIAADTSSLPEVVGEAGVLVDPLDVEAITRAIQQVCAEQELRESLRVRGLAQAKKFTWDAAAKKTLCVLEMVGR